MNITRWSDGGIKLTVWDETYDCQRVLEVRRHTPDQPVNIGVTTYLPDGPNTAGLSLTTAEAGEVLAAIARTMKP